MVVWMASAHLTAFTTLANSARMPSPAVIYNSPDTPSHGANKIKELW
jgi:hypothetical protein